MSGSTTSNNTSPSVTTPSDTGAAPGGGAGSSSIGGSTSGLTTPTLPPQYATGNQGFYTRQTEYVTTGVTTGPDGALYVSGLTAIPYPTGYSNIYRIADPSATTGFDGNTPSGVPQVYASGFTQVVSLSFNNGTGDLYVLDYLNGGSIYDPTLQVSDLPPSQLIKVAPDGTRTTLSGPELRFGNYVLVDQATGDAYVAIGNDGPATATAPGTGEVLRYHTDPSTGTSSYTVVASELDNPRGMSFGPDGNLYVLESGSGTPAGTPGVDTAPVIPFLPGLVSERGGYTGSITRVDTTGPAGGQERVFTGLPSFREFNPATGEDRIISIGPNALTITPDGTVFIAGGGGLAPETAAAIGSFADGLNGVVKLTGLFGSDPANATYSTVFDTLAYAAANGPDGETTLFNTESNIYDITQGANGELYVADAARNLVYGFSSDGTTLDNVTVLQKQPPVLTPPQYAAEVAAGGDPTAQYAAEISNVTFKGPGGLPDVPGTLPPNPALNGAGPFASAPPEAPQSAPPGSAPSGAPTGAPPDTTSASGPPSGPPPDGSGAPPGEGPPPDGASAYPGPSDPITPPVLPNNIYTNYYDPFFGNFAPAPSTPLVLPAGADGQYTVSKLVVFGDRLADNGNTAALQRSLGQAPGTTAAPYSPVGNFSDGPKWTTDLAQILGASAPSQQENFAYESATARDLGVPNLFDPDASKTSLDTFAGQIQQFKQQGGSFSPNELVSVTFGGNDISLPSTESPEQGVTDSVNAVLDGIQQLADLGATHFLVSNLPDITLAPLFNSPEFQQATGATPEQFQGLVDQFNTQLAAGLSTFRDQSGIDAKELDLHTLFKGIQDNPTAYGFTNITQPVLISTPDIGSAPVYNPAIVGEDPQVQHGSLFLDPYFDPTALGQAIIAQTARNTLLG